MIRSRAGVRRPGSLHRSAHGRCIARTGGALVEHVFASPDNLPDYWSFSEIELARSCLLLAESPSGRRNGLLRAEAMQLFLLGREAINARDGTRDQREDRVALLWGSARGRFRTWCG